MFPQEVAEYVTALKAAVQIPVGFHCHSNMGMCAANVLAAYQNGAHILDCGLLGMARSAGNIPTELATALMQRENQCKEINFYGLLHYLDRELIPAMLREGYHTPLTPLDLVLGYSGCHSSFVKKFAKIAAETNADFYRLIMEVSAQNRRDPDETLMRKVAAKISR